MRLYFAPMEGITTYTYRNTHNEMFGGCDAYFAPFITPDGNEKPGNKCLRDIVPEVNKNIKLRVQLLTNNADSFLMFERKLTDLGYNEVNINLGCPSGTVVKKNRGSGFLRNPEMLDNFLEQVYSNSRLEISVKTRSGFASGTELGKLVEIYNKYPVSELIIHPRSRAEQYKGEPDMQVFEKAYNNSKNKVCYNGNVFSAVKYREITQNYSKLGSVMLGRGAVMNPAIFREIRGGAPLETNELSEFTQLLAERYLKLLRSEVFTLHKLKEIWMYIMWNFPNEKKLLKSIKKSSSIEELMTSVRLLPRL